MKPLLSNVHRDKEIELAKQARNRFIELLTKQRTITVDCFEFDKYGRVLVNIYNGVDKESVNEIMIREKHGRPYDGGKKEAWF
jgi:endonuclease YncB( thermonuclease family)